MTVFKPDGADWQIQAEAEASRQLDLAGANLADAAGQSAGIKERNRPQAAAQIADQFGIGRPFPNSADGVSPHLGSEFPLRKTPNAAGAPVEKAKIDREIAIIAG